jgi:hypothetical protein
MLPRFSSQRDKSATDLTNLSGVLEFICYKKSTCVGKLTSHGRVLRSGATIINGELGKIMLGYYHRTGWKLPVATRILNKYRRFRQQNQAYHPTAFFALDAMVAGLKILPVVIAFMLIYSQVR